jgi:hypothetical protein
MYTLQRTDKRTWSLLDANGTVLGSLVRTKWHGMGAEILVAQGVYPVRRLSVWSSKLGVFAGEVPLLVASFTWRGIDIHDPTGQQPSTSVRRPHWFSAVHELVSGERPVLKLRHRMNWRRFEQEPEIMEAYTDSIPPLMLLFALHAIQVQQRRAAAAAAS